MADLSTFPTISKVLRSGDNIQGFTATTDVKAGQVVSFHATGVDFSVIPATVGLPVAGVALYDADAGDEVAIAMDGCIVKVQNGDDTATCDAGDRVEIGVNTTIGGTVSALSLTIATANHECAGRLLSDMAASGVAYMMVAPFIQIDAT